MKIDELIKELKYTVLHLPWSQIRQDADEVVGGVVATLEAQQARIAELEAKLREERRWIPVGERLPEQGQEVIVYDGGVLKPKVYCYLFWNKDYDSWARVTHWMPLPQPPEVDGLWQKTRKRR